MTQKTLTRRLRVSRPFIAKLEKAETHNFTLDTLIKVVTTLNGELVLHNNPAKPTWHRARLTPSLSRFGGE